MTTRTFTAASTTSASGPRQPTTRRGARCSDSSNAADWREIVFTRNATEAINLVAACFARPKLQPGDEILVTEMEHHANIVPWQMAAAATGAKVVAAPVSDEGELLLDAFVERITERTRMIAVAWVSNVLGTVNPVHELVRIAHSRGIPILIDAAQAVQHIPVDVQDLDADFSSSPATSCTGRPASAFSTARPRASRRCRPTRAAGT